VNEVATNGRPQWVKTVQASWPLAVSVCGMAGCLVLLFIPELRDNTILIVFGGAAGFGPTDKLLTYLSAIKGAKK
jgi:hypothetical protein